MDSTKPTLSSKTVITNVLLAITNLLILLGVFSSDLGVDEIATAGGAAAVVNFIGNLLSAYFRKTATAKLT